MLKEFGRLKVDHEIELCWFSVFMQLNMISEKSAQFVGVLPFGVVRPDCDVLAVTQLLTAR